MWLGSAEVETWGELLSIHGRGEEANRDERYTIIRGSAVLSWLKPVSRHGPRLLWWPSVVLNPSRAAAIKMWFYKLVSRRRAQAFCLRGAIEGETMEKNTYFLCNGACGEDGRGNFHAGREGENKGLHWRVSGL